MSGENTGFVPNPSAWTQPPPLVRHAYGLVVRDHGLGTAFGLLMQSVPYALARFRSEERRVGKEC